MEPVDVAVVGGGPGGSSAAWMAAYTGADVLVLERGVPRSDRPGRGPDSTDAGGLLDYWIDMMGIPIESIPEEVIHRHLEGADFYSPHEHLAIDETGMVSDFDSFGVTIDRVAFDDWLRDQAEASGAAYEVGTTVRDVETRLTSNGYRHRLTLSTGELIETEYLILADGPQRSVTIDVLDQFTPADQSMADRLDPTRANHIAYQEYRRVPPELYETNRLTFWWGFIPGHTAYPWLFPNDENVVRLGFTMPIGLRRESFASDAWPLLRTDDDHLPSGRHLLERLVDLAFPGYDLADFPLVDNRGKQHGIETYPISSTRPIDSPTAAGIAVVGGAMGATSAFHEGGYHLAVRTGRLAGYLAGRGDLERYNETWRRAIGAEIRRNVTMETMVRGYGPADWDRLFRTVSKMKGANGPGPVRLIQTGGSGMRLAYQFIRHNRQYRDDRYVQFDESEYQLGP